MVTKLEDFLRRRTKIAMVMRHDEQAGSGGLQESGEILFGADAAARHAEYFAGAA
jgi:glycerol-3-phosphate dehydrogenase